MPKVTLGDVFKNKGLEVLTYINKKDIAENEVVFCILDAKKVNVPNSQFNQPEQWLLTVLVPVGTEKEVRKYWLVFAPNETRDDFMEAIIEGLEEAHNQGCKAVHSAKLQAIPLAKYDNPFYALNFTKDECLCGLDTE